MFMKIGWNTSANLLGCWRRVRIILWKNDFDVINAVYCFATIFCMKVERATNYWMTAVCFQLQSVWTWS